MAGGIWLAQNKERAGAYINFQSVPRPMTTLGTRGVVAIPMALPWGPENTVITLYSDELLSNTSEAKIGYTAFDAESRMIRNVLSNAYLAYIYRIDTGGTQASAEALGISATAKYAGSAGNNITIQIKKLSTSPATYRVDTYYKTKLKDSQVISAVAELDDNDFVIFDAASGSSSLAEGLLQLTNGTNGTIADANYASFIEAVSPYRWNTMIVPYNYDPDEPGDLTKLAAINESVVTFITNMRENHGRKVQAVIGAGVPSATNTEGVINVKTLLEINGEEYTMPDMVALIGGLEAAAQIGESLTYYEMAGATSILNPLDDAGIKEAIKNGELVITTTQSGRIVIESDINSYHTFTPEKNRDYSKNMIIRMLDTINNDIAEIWETTYIGKIKNNTAGRDAFKADLINYFNVLATNGYIEDFNGVRDITVLPGEENDAVVVTVNIQPVDAVEKLYLTVYTS